MSEREEASKPESDSESDSSSNSESSATSPTEHVGLLELAGETRRFERRLPHPPAKVWRALTEPGEVEKWFPATIEGEREEGAKLRFVFEKNEHGESEPSVEGEITRCDPPHVLTYTMGRETLHWELVPIPEGTLLVFTTEVRSMFTRAISSAPANDNAILALAA